MNRIAGAVWQPPQASLDGRELLLGLPEGAGEEGTRRLMQIIRTWSALKLWHVQFNILNKQTLLDAQRDPEKYRNLVVRIAGYSAYFVDLSPMQQAEIIARTEEAA